MSNKETKLQKTAARLLALFERHEPAAPCEKCGEIAGRREAWYCFTLDAIKAKSDNYEAMSTLVDDAAPDADAGYEWITDVLAAIEEGSITSDDDISEWADGATPVYTYTLLQWFAESTHRLDLISDMQSEYGNDGTSNGTGGGAMLMAAYCYGLDRFARSVYDAVVNIADNE